MNLVLWPLLSACSLLATDEHTPSPSPKGEIAEPMPEEAPSGEDLAPTQAPGSEERCVTPEMAAALSDTETLARAGRVIPHLDANGNSDGFRLSGLRSGEIVDRMGLKNGDILHTVNGVALRSVETAMTLYSTLASENAERITLGLTRRGSPHVIVLNFGQCAQGAREGAP